MKTPQDPRHQRRIHLMQELFTVGFDHAHPSEDLGDIMGVLARIDKRIEESAPEWPLPKIAKIDVAILRLAAYELIIETKEPPKVIIDEAVELAKEFGNENSPKFVNGVLGTILKSL